jgi:predicted transcriptional regulator
MVDLILTPIWLYSNQRYVEAVMELQNLRMSKVHQSLGMKLSKVHHALGILSQTNQIKK